MVLYREDDVNPCMGASFFSTGWTYHPEFLFHDSVCPLGYHKYHLPFLWCPIYTMWKVQLRSMCGREKALWVVLSYRSAEALLWQPRMGISEIGMGSFIFPWKTGFHTVFSMFRGRRTTA